MIENQLVPDGDQPVDDEGHRTLLAAKDELLGELRVAFSRERMRPSTVEEAEELYDAVRRADTPEGVLDVRRRCASLLARDPFVPDKAPAKGRLRLTRPIAGGLAAAAVVAGAGGAGIWRLQESREADELRAVNDRACVFGLDYRAAAVTALAGAAHHQTLESIGMLDADGRSAAATEVQQALRPLMNSGNQALGEMAVEMAREDIADGTTAVYATTVQDMLLSPAEWRASMLAVADDLRRIGLAPVTDVCVTPPAGADAVDAGEAAAVLQAASTAADHVSRIVRADAGRTVQQASRSRALPPAAAGRTPAVPARPSR